MRWTYDAGAAITAFPLDARMGTETEPNEASYKTASGELIPDRGGLRVQGVSESVRSVVLDGRKADVHKPLVSAGAIAQKGHVAVLGDLGGYIVPRGSPLARKIRELVHREAPREAATIQLYQEKGTYAGYLRVPAGCVQTPALAGTGSGAALCPVSLSSGASLSGGPRQPQA